MSDRQLMQQALEALDVLRKAGELKLVNAAIESLRARLAGPVAEPVGYWDGKFSDSGAAILYEVPQKSAFGFKYRNEPLYTTPPTPRPLTDEEIKQAVLNDPIYGAALMSMMRDGVTVAQLREAVSGIARAIERAHKITGGNDDRP